MRLTSSEQLMIERVVLEQIKLGARVEIGEALLASAEVSTWVNEISRSLTYQLEAFLQAEHLAPDRIDLDFTEYVEVEHRLNKVFYAPRGRVDRLLWVLPRWLRWRHPKMRVAGVARAPGHVMTEPVRIRKQVVIERMLGYPESTVMVPRDRLGAPIYIERLRT